MIVARFFILVLATLLALSLGLGGYDSIEHFEFAGSLVLFFWTIPVLIIMLLLLGLEKLIGEAGPFVIALIGCIPFVFVLLEKTAHGGHAHTLVDIGLAWSALWILTYFRVHGRKSPADDPQSNGKV